MSKENNEIDDNDLDSFLDDALDNFNNQSIPTAQPVKRPINEKTESDVNTNNTEFEGIDDEMAKQLAEGMYKLLEEMNADPALESNIEKITSELGNDLKLNDDSSIQTGQTKKPKQSFQDTISETINNLKNSSEKVEAEVSEANNDTMEKMLKQIEGLVDDDFCDVLSGIMDQLTSKELLYDSMKDLADRYPSWIEENKTKLPQKEIERYQHQYESCKKIVDIFESYEKDDVSEEDKKKITDLMQTMQEYGNPPSEILKELAPDMILGLDDTPQLPDTIPDGDCAQQ